MFDFSAKHVLGQTKIHVSRIAFGCWGISGDWGFEHDKEYVLQILNEAWEQGINFFDTARVYGGGYGEEMFNQVPWRHQAILATKLSAKEKPVAPIQQISQYYTRKYILSQVDDSLRRLQRDYIDVLQLHNWYREWDVDGEYVFSVFQDLKSRGKIRAVGVSLPNWLDEDMTQLLSSGMIDVVQTPFNLFQQWALEKVFKPANHYGVGVLVRSPLEHGALASLVSEGRPCMADSMNVKSTASA